MYHRFLLIVGSIIKLTKDESNLLQLVSIVCGVMCGGRCNVCVVLCWWW